MDNNNENSKMPVESIFKALNMELEFSMCAGASLSFIGEGGVLVELDYSATDGWDLVNSDYNNHPLVSDPDGIDDFIFEKVSGKVVWVEDLFDDLYCRIAKEFE